MAINLTNHILHRKLKIFSELRFFKMTKVKPIPPSNKTSDDISASIFLAGKKQWSTKCLSLIYSNYQSLKAAVNIFPPLRHLSQLSRYCRLTMYFILYPAGLHLGSFFVQIFFNECIFCIFTIKNWSQFLTLSFFLNECIHILPPVYHTTIITKHACLVHKDHLLLQQPYFIYTMNNGQKIRIRPLDNVKKCTRKVVSSQHSSAIKMGHHACRNAVRHTVFNFIRKLITLYTLISFFGQVYSHYYCKTLSGFYVLWRGDLRLVCTKKLFICKIRHN